MAALAQGVAPRGEAEAVKGFWPHLENYLDTPSGIESFFECAARIADAVKLWSPCRHVSDVAGRVQDLAENVGFGLSMPKIPIEGASLYHAAWSVFESGKENLGRVLKAVFLKTLAFLNAVAKTALFAHSFSVLRLTACLAGRISGFSNAASLVMDGADLFQDWAQGQETDAPIEKCNLACMNVVKNASSVAISALLLVGYAFEMATQPHMVLAVFTLNSVFLASKLMGCFYDRMVVQALPKTPHPVS